MSDQDNTDRRRPLTTVTDAGSSSRVVRSRETSISASTDSETAKIISAAPTIQTTTDQSNAAASTSSTAPTTAPAAAIASARTGGAARSANRSSGPAAVDTRPA